jgi:hypothetical protein
VVILEKNKRNFQIKAPSEIEDEEDDSQEFNEINYGKNVSHLKRM